MASINVSELAVIPFLDQKVLAGRVLYSLMFYDGEWHAWTEADGRIIKLQMWPAEATYFGTKPELPTDLSFHFLNIIAQRVCFEKMAKPFFALQDDIFNLSASLAKFDLFHSAGATIKHGVSRMVATEIEYIHGVCRSIFDLWQEIILKLWASFQLIGGKYSKRPLKKSYGAMVFEGESIRTSDDLEKRFGLPTALARCYAESASFFQDLQKFRDNLVHHGSSAPIVFQGEDDLLIDELRAPFKTFPIWTPEDRKPNRLVPLRLALAYVIHKTLGTCDRFSRTIETSFILPPPIVPSMNLFLRGFFNEALLRQIQEIDRRLTPKVQAE